MALDRTEYFLFAIVILSDFLFSQLLNGWIGFNAAFIKSGYYGWLCDNPNEHCDAQLTSLNTVYNTCTAVSLMMCLPCGMLLDATSPRFCSIISGILVSAGMLGIGLARQVGTSFDLFFPSTMVMAVGGILCAQVSFQLPFVFVEHATFAMTMIGCAASGCGEIGEIVRLISGAGVSIELIMITFAVVAAIVLSMMATAWHWKHDELMQVRALATEATKQPAFVDDAPTLANLPLGKQLQTHEFCILAIYISIMLWRLCLYMGTMDLVNTQLADWAGESHSDVMTVSNISATVYGLMFLPGPLLDWITERVDAFTFINITLGTSIVVSLCQFVPNVYFQVFTAALMGINGTAYYIGFQGFCFANFGALSTATITGAAFFVAGLVNFTLTPTVDWAISIHNFIPVNIIALAIFLPAAAYVFYVRSKQQSSARDIPSEALIQRTTSQEVAKDDVQADRQHVSRDAARPHDKGDPPTMPCVTIPHGATSCRKARDGTIEENEEAYVEG